MDDTNRLLTELHDQMMSEEYKAEIALELEGVERGIQNVQSEMVKSGGRDALRLKISCYTNVPIPFAVEIPWKSI